MSGTIFPIPDPNIAIFESPFKGIIENVIKNGHYSPADFCNVIDVEVQKMMAQIESELPSNQKKANRK